MKKILFLMALSVVFAFAGCKKTVVQSLDRAGVKPGSGIATMLGCGNVEYESECVTKDELGVIYDREHFGYDIQKNQSKLEVKLQGLYKKAKAGCKE